jgi:hypothetical protein
MTRIPVYGIFENKEQVDRATAVMEALHLEVNVTGIRQTNALGCVGFWQYIDSPSTNLLFLWIVAGAIAGALSGILSIQTGDPHMVLALASHWAIYGAVAGALLGLLCGGIIALNGTEDKNRFPKHKVGSYLVSTHAHDSEERARIEEILKESGALEDAQQTKRTIVP